nr:sporulation initiation factor Spo0A [Ruminococcus sp.]
MKLNEIFKQIAVKNGVSVKQVHQDIQEAFDEGWNSSDEKVREYWHKIPTKHKKPTLEEVILYIVTECTK